MTESLWPGDVVWVELDGGSETHGEQRGRRPALVVSSPEHLAVTDRLVTVLPATSRDRGWPNHVRLTGPSLARATFAMTEQIRTVDRRRVVAMAGRVTDDCLREVLDWVGHWLAHPERRDPRRR
ncbi:MAG: type II toxin-antitoxin system PemK/MazF family toxin [Candidatus Nanopelagicales bacterium]